MYIYGNNNSCSVNNECESGYSLYFPCVKTITRGENVCIDFYIVDNTTREEVDLREVDDITLNISGRYKCNFGSFSYPENIKSSQIEKFSETIYNITFLDIINNIKLYIDIVDENHKLIESFLFNKNLILDIAIDGNIGYFINCSEQYGLLNLTGFDTKEYIFLGWDIDGYYEECDTVNMYDFLIKKNNLSFFVTDDSTIRIVYQKRREYTIVMDSENYNSSFVVEYMGEKTVLKKYESVTVLEGHDIKVSCIPYDIKPYKFVEWEDGYKNPYRVINIGGDNLTISLKAYCELSNNNVNYEDNINASSLNNFKHIYPNIIDSIFVDNFFIDNIHIFNCEIDILNDIPYIKIVNDGYIQIKDIDYIGNLKLLIDNKGGDCKLFVGNYNVQSLFSEKNEFIFDFNGEIITLKGEDSCVFGLSLYKEIIYDKGKCMICFNSNESLNFHPGELIAEGGVIINGNPYGLSPIKIGTVNNISPLIIK